MMSVITPLNNVDVTEFRFFTRGSRSRLQSSCIVIINGYTARPQTLSLHQVDRQ